jgi:hypothetical protein
MEIYFNGGKLIFDQNDERLKNLKIQIDTGSIIIDGEINNFGTFIKKGITIFDGNIINKI